MVDCGTNRCLQERKDFRKELLSWSRKIPLAIGLESVASRLAGKLDITQLFQPWSDKKEEDNDWSPPENCFYCSEKIPHHPLRNCITDTGLDVSGSGFSDSVEGPLDLSSSGTPHSPSMDDSPSKSQHVQLKVPVIKKSEPKPPKRPSSASMEPPSKSRRSVYKSDSPDLLPHTSEPSCWDDKLNEIRRKHNISGKRQDNIYSHAPFTHEMSLPFIPELIRKMALQTMKQHETKEEPLNLKIPSCESEENESLKNIVTKTISDKIRSRYPYPSMPPLLPAPMPAYSSLQNLVNGQTPVRAEKRKKQPKDETPKEPGRKGSRPKRGQYRKYNNQLLVEAVKAVQRGEMSVHRAGSYYGVPHSTLEYKVKERHLLRKKKKEAEKAALAEQQAKEGKEPIATPKPVLQPKPINNNNNTKIKNLLPAQVNYNSPLLANPALFWPLDSAFLTPQIMMPPAPLCAESELPYAPLTMSAPASDMLKKLQQKASSGAVFPGMIESQDEK